MRIPHRKLSIKGELTLVKENYIRFKGKGTRIHLQKPEGMHASWTPKGSYTMLETIKHLPNIAAVDILDNYSVHVTEDIRKALLARRYISVCTGGGCE